MKYFKAKFTIADAVSSSPLTDPVTLQTARDLVAALAGSAGFEAFEDTQDGLTGYVQTTLYDAPTLQAMLQQFPMEGIEVALSVEDAEDRDWNEQWEQQGFEPIVVADRCIIHDTLHAVDGGHYPIDITIEARQAFGTGTHNTTQMIVERLLGTPLEGKSFLDCGCGTGILSIAAAKLGAARVAAYDIDEWSVENAMHNARLNGVEGMAVKEGDVSVLATFSETFDVVVANINRNILLADMQQMATRMHPGSLFIISGFYPADAPMLTARAQSLGLQPVADATSGDWQMLVFEHQ